MTLRLPDGWRAADFEHAARLQREYELELPEVHPLHGVAVRVIADCDGSDDVLVQHVGTDRFSVVHLTWRMARELPNHPTVEFTGTFDEFVAWEARWLEVNGSH
jgi:hypothetical protein